MEGLAVCLFEGLAVCCLRVWHPDPLAGVRPRRFTQAPLPGGTRSGCLTGVLQSCVPAITATNVQRLTGAPSRSDGAAAEAAGGGRGAPRNRIPWGEGLRPAPPETQPLQKLSDSERVRGLLVLRSPPQAEPTFRAMACVGRPPRARCWADGFPFGEPARLA